MGDMSWCIRQGPVWKNEITLNVWNRGDLTQRIGYTRDRRARTKMGTTRKPRDSQQLGATRLKWKKRGGVIRSQELESRRGDEREMASGTYTSWGFYRKDAISLASPFLPSCLLSVPPSRQTQADTSQCKGLSHAACRVRHPATQERAGSGEDWICGQSHPGQAQRINTNTRREKVNAIIDFFSKVARPKKYRVTMCLFCGGEGLGKLLGGDDRWARSWVRRERMKWKQGGREHFRRGDGMRRTTASEEVLASPGAERALRRAGHVGRKAAQRR